MKYYSNWQSALIDFVKLFGHNYIDSYPLMEDFELRLKQNIKGTYFIYFSERDMELLK